MSQGPRSFGFTELCEGTNILFVQAFAEDGTVLADTSVVNGNHQTIKLTFSSTPASRVLITSSKTCGSGLFKGVETFALDTIALKRLEEWRVRTNLRPIGPIAAYIDFAGQLGLGNSAPNRIELKNIGR